MEQPQKADNSLLETTDAMKWAEAFCNQFQGALVAASEHEEGDVDPSLMVGWFANAMGAQEMQLAKEDRERLEARGNQIECPRHLLPGDRGSAGCNMRMLASLASAYNSKHFPPEMPLKPWVILGGKCLLLYAD